MTSLTASLKLDAATEERLRRLAAARKLPAQGLMREAIEQYVEREEANERLNEDTLAAWAAYQATGEHIAGEEADAWLARLEAGEDVPPPGGQGPAFGARWVQSARRDWTLTASNPAVSPLDG